MTLLHRIIERVIVIGVLSFYMQNKDIQIQLNFFGLTQPVNAHLGQIITLAVAVGLFLCIIGDIFSQLKGMRDRNRMVKRDKEHQGEVERLEERVQELEKEADTLKAERDGKAKLIRSLEEQVATYSAAVAAESPASGYSSPKATPDEDKKGDK
jgi:hypothetical protein